jgi:signal transduction histidine kinase
MRRALKIVSRRRHPEPEESVLRAIPARTCPPSPEARAVGGADPHLKSRLVLRKGPAQVRREQTFGETKKEKIALETINRLMLTVSHYLSNPLTILLGRIELLSEATENGGLSKEDTKKFIESCKREINKIDLIIKVFQNLCEVRYKTFPPGIEMLDVEREIKSRLKEIECCLRHE